VFAQSVTTDPVTFKASHLRLELDATGTAPMSVTVHYEIFMTLTFEPTVRRCSLQTLMLVHHRDAFQLAIPG
jgi:hypothetical protein